MTPDQFRAFMEDELVRWTKAVRASGATGD
jgi:hypothetical protein